MATIAELVWQLEHPGEPLPSTDSQQRVADYIAQNPTISPQYAQYLQSLAGGSMAGLALNYIQQPVEQGQAAWENYTPGNNVFGAVPSWVPGSNGANEVLGGAASSMGDLSQGTTTTDPFENGRVAISMLDPNVFVANQANNLAGQWGMDEPYAENDINNYVDTANTVGALTALYYGGSALAGGEGAAAGAGAGEGAGAGAGAGSAAGAGATTMGTTNPITGAAMTSGTGSFGTATGAATGVNTVAPAATGFNWGSAIPALVQAAGYAAVGSQAGNDGGGAAAADPFAAERPQYQQMLEELLNNPSSFLDSPFVQGQLDLGTQAINRQMAGRGFLDSGNRYMELEKYGQQLASSSLLDYANLLGGFSGATSGSPGTAGTILAGGQQDQNQAYLDAFTSLTPLIMQISGYGEKKE